MLNSWTKILLSFSLICYVTVSSIAVVHALPRLAEDLQHLESPTIETTLLDVSYGAEMSTSKAGCHQPQGDSSQKAASACELFCTAMANIIVNELALDLPAKVLSTEIIFRSNIFHTREPAMEPQPPK